MVSTVLSATIDGLNVKFVQVEADVSNGLPMLHMVGYLSAEVKDAGERVRSAIANTGFHIPPKKMIINLSPATVKKRGASFDLPIAAAILSALGYIDASTLNQLLLIGELGLDGDVRKVPGVLPIVLDARERGIHTCMIPYANLSEGMIVNGMKIIGIKCLQDLVNYSSNPEKFKNIENAVAFDDCENGKKETLDFKDIQGQDTLKRAVEVAVAGGHNILFVGTPGSSKTMIAKRIPSILPPLTMEESIEISKIYSVMGLLNENQSALYKRPFRQIHHTATKTALVGGGVIPRPGEITLAHKGVLMMDELAEFPRGVLEVLRQPLEEQQIQIVRSRGTYVFPAEFILVAAMNPCPCGYYPDMEKCKCTQTQVNHYLGKISQPFLSRIDICVEAPRVDYVDLSRKKVNESSETICKRVCAVREIQKQRYKNETYQTNSRIPTAQIMKHCSLNKECEKMMSVAYDKMNLTARSYHKILRVARTIADLSGAVSIDTIHLSEALSYRSLNDKYWES